MADSPLKDEITSNAEGPAEMEGDEGRVHQHRLTEQIAADQYLAAQRAAEAGVTGLRFFKISPPSAV